MLELGVGAIAPDCTQIEYCPTPIRLTFAFIIQPACSALRPTTHVYLSHPVISLTNRVCLPDPVISPMTRLYVVSRQITHPPDLADPVPGPTYVSSVMRSVPSGHPSHGPPVCSIPFYNPPPIRCPTTHICLVLSPQLSHDLSVYTCQETAGWPHDRPHPTLKTV